MSFYKFLESVLLEEVNDDAFIRKFFVGFINLSNYDEITLKVFAKSLEENDDPRSQLVALSSSQTDLGSEPKRIRLANELGIRKTTTLFNTSSNAKNVLLSGRYWAVTSGIEKNISLVMDERGKAEWRDSKKMNLDAGINGVISLNQVKPNVLAEFFWNLLGYGFGVHE